MSIYYYQDFHAVMIKAVTASGKLGKWCCYG